jgi:L-malate glycosyltransferase
VTTVHQIVVGVGPGDAITQMALGIRTALGGRGVSDIFAKFIEPSLAGEVRTLDGLPAGRPSDVIVYHSSFGDPDVTRAVLRRPEQLILVYHNITPSHFFVEHDPAFAAGLEWGRHELSLLRDRVSLSIADSDFNAHELVSMGFDGVHTIPAGVHPGRLTSITPSYRTLQHLDDEMPCPYVLNVSQLLPHKCQHVLIQAAHVLQMIHGIEIGLILVGTPRSRAYTTALHELTRRLRVRNVWFAGRQLDSDLATIYHRASIFASASSHEGLGIPPLEAMAFGVPVIVRDAAAVAETVGSGALVLPNDAGPLLFAEAIGRVLADDALQGDLICRGESRLVQLSAHDGTEALIDLLTQQVLSR